MAYSEKTFISDADRLTINPSVEETQQLQKLLLQLLRPLAIVSSGTGRLQVELPVTTVVSGAVTSTVSGNVSISNNPNVGFTFEILYNNGVIGYAQAVRPKLTF